MEAMCTAYMKSRPQSQHISNKTWGKWSQPAPEYREGKVHTVYFWNASFVYLLYFFSFVCISEFLYANYSSTCVGCMHIVKSKCDCWKIHTICKLYMSYSIVHSQEWSMSKFFLQRHQKPNITQMRDYHTQMEDYYTTNSHYPAYTFLFKRMGECTFWTWRVKGLKHTLV